MDKELFILCKKVYKRTGWKDTFAIYEQTDSIPEGEPYMAYPELERRCGLWSTQEVRKQTPLYDSDYLLEKLPYQVNKNLLNMYKTDTQYTFLYGMISVAHVTGLSGEANTPLKALLKLVIALDNAKELR